MQNAQASLEQTVVPSIELGQAGTALRIVSSAVPKSEFFDLSRAELEVLLRDEYASKAYRSTQVFEWVYRKGARDFVSMTNVNEDLRRALTERFSFPRAAIKERQISSDGTRKYLFETSLGNLVESVMIKQPTRMTLCVSSQVGCGMGCGFCRTATMGFRKNLTTSEILQQVIGVIEDAKNFNDSFQNIVFMGMGEPLHNYNNVTRALSILRDQKGFDFSGRKITVSSVGLVPAIAKFGKSGLDVNLAVSLNATDDAVRSRIMPINKAFPIQRLLETLREFPLKPRRKITIEYVMLAGVNDREEDLKRLPKILKGLQVKVNLIPYNENAGLGFRSPTKEKVFEWLDRLHNSGLDTTIRWSRGADIKAACGQLLSDREPQIDAAVVEKVMEIATQVSNEQISNEQEASAAIEA